MIQLIILVRRTLFLTWRLRDKWLHANYNSEALQGIPAQNRGLIDN